MCLKDKVKNKKHEIRENREEQRSLILFDVQFMPEENSTFYDKIHTDPQVTIIIRVIDNMCVRKRCMQCIL